MSDERERALVREALRQAGEQAEPAIDGLLGAVPSMLEEASRRRHAGQELLASSVPLARTAIPRLAAAAVLLVAISTALLLTGDDRTTVTTTTVATSDTLDTMLLRGNGITDEWMLQSILEPPSTEVE